MNLPIRVRLTAWYVGLLTAILAVLAAFLLVRMRAELIDSVDQSLDDRADDVGTALAATGHASLRELDTDRLVPLHGQPAAQLLDPGGAVRQASGDPVAARPMLGPWALARAARGRQVRATVHLGPERRRYRLLAVPATASLPTNSPPTGSPPIGVLVLAVPLNEVDESVRDLLLLLLVGGAAALALAGGGGWLLARKALLPVTRMTRQAAAIGADRLHERVAVPPTADELGRLAATLNAMLDRIERGVADQHRLVADASHELRTPLAVMRSELEVSLRSPGLAADAREVLSSANEEVERMSRIVDNLLTLARIDEGRLQLLRTPERLDALVDEVLGKLRPLAAAKRVTLRREGAGAVVLGDRRQLELVVTNLVDNAIKYTGAGGEVCVRTWHQDGMAGCSVTDTGPGIAADALPHVFDRFYRVDAARSRAQGGSGLGLAICREIVEAHGGRVWASSEPAKGSSFSLAIPV